MRPIQKRQFRALYRHSLGRLIDLEIISSRGDLYGLVARSGGILVALSLMLVVMVVAPYARIAPALRPIGHLRSDAEFLVSITLAVTGLFSVLAWNNLLPDRRDCLILGLLPVRTRTVAWSRLAAVLTCIGVLIVLTNGLTGFTFPYMLARQPGESLRAVAAWWVAMTGAGIFAFAWTLMLQGTAAQLFRWHTFLRVSAALQFAALFVILGLFFLTPPFAWTMATRPQLAAFLPSYWFTGLLSVLKGDADPAMRSLAWIAVRNSALSVGSASLLFVLSWCRPMRMIVEAPDIATRSGQTLASWCGNLLVKSLVRRQLDRAILLFTARTAARSRQHRLLLAAYGGIGLALAVTFSKGLMGVRSDLRWSQPSVSMLVIAVLPLVCAVRATRSVFALPHALSSNWIFRITAVHSAPRYFDAVKKTLIAIAAAPAWIVSLGVLLAIWPSRYSIEACTVIVLLGLILVEYALYQFRKIPFTCSWLPASGQSLSAVRALGYAIGFLAFASALAGLELWAIRSFGRFVVLAGGLAAWAWWLRQRGRDFAASAAGALQFDDLPPAEILSLDLRPDGEWAGAEAFEGSA
jgi:hypothetical protein